MTADPWQVARQATTVRSRRITRAEGQEQEHGTQNENPRQENKCASTSEEPERSNATITTTEAHNPSY